MTAITAGTTITTSGNYTITNLTNNGVTGTVFATGAGVVGDLTIGTVGVGAGVEALMGATWVIENVGSRLAGDSINFDLGGTKVSGQPNNSGTIELTAGYSNPNNTQSDFFNFSPGGFLTVDQGANIAHGLVNNFSEADGDAICFKGIDVQSETVVFNWNTGYSTVTMYSGLKQTGSVLGTWQVSGMHSVADEKFTYDAAMGCTVYCLLRGTSVATPDGERAVEALQVGDVVATASGAARPIAWIGRRTYRAAQQSRPELVQPIRIAAGAIADGVPSRDLLVSPDHAVLLDGKLIPARLLINGFTIVQEPRATFEYFHIELDAHDAMLAEGLAVESFLNVGQARAAFENPAVALLHPATQPHEVLAAYEAEGCAPLAVEREAVEPVWRALALRAGVTFAEVASTGPAQPMLLAKGRRLRPAGVQGSVFLFAVLPGCEEVTLASPAAMPAAARPWLNDRRMLGLAVQRIRLRNDGDVVDLPLDAPALGRGWWDMEGQGASAFRWTDGAAVLALPANMRGGALLEITVIGHAEPMPAALDALSKVA